MLKIVTTALTRLLVGLSSMRGTACAIGAVTGCYLLAIFSQFAATFGCTLPFLAGSCLASALGCELALWRSQRTTIDREPFLWLAVPFGLLSCWVIAFPGLVWLILSAAGWFDVRTMSYPLVESSYAAISAIILLAPPAYWIVRSLSVIDTAGATAGASRSAVAIEKHPAQNLGRWYALGLIAGLMIDALLFAPYIGVQIASWLAAGFSVAPIFGYWWHLRVQPSTVAGQEVHERPDELSSSAADSNLSWTATAWQHIFVVLALGAAFAVVTRMIRQLMPGVAVIVCTEWAALAGGMLLGRFWIERSAWHGRQVVRPWTTAVMCAAWMVALLAAFPWLVDLMLELNASVSQVALLQSVRLLTVALLVLPLSLTWGAVSCRIEAQGATDPPEADRRSWDENRAFAWMPNWSLLAFVAAYVLCRAFAIPQLGMPTVCLIAAGWLLLTGIVVSLWDAESGRLDIAGWRARTWPRTRLRQVAVVAGLLLVVLSPLWRHNYDPARSARLLFSSAVSSAKASGLDGESLLVLDEGRLLTVTETPRSTYTLWKGRGAQLQLREDGIPKAVVSTDPGIFPHYSAEVMPTVLPLILHERPHHVLLLGLGGGLPVVTTLDFPVVQVTCAESDPGLRSQVEDLVWTNSVQAPGDDDRLRWLGCSPTLALACRDGSYDVIVSNADQAALPHSAFCFTAEFYRRAADRLSEGGIFCQRFQCIDFGPEPLRIAAGTLSDVFEHVAIVEPAPGELVLLGTNGEAGLVRDGLVERCQAPQVRYTLSQFGWDWVVPLNLSAFGRENLAEFVSERGSRLNTAANGCFAFTLPQEVMRWGAKQQELFAQLAHRSENLLSWDATDSDEPDVLSRISEVNVQRQLMTDSPDEFWAYRGVVRKRVTQRPRSVIRQVSGQAPRQTLHPEEKRRMRYFEKLGAALKNPKPDVAKIEEVAEFSQPYDPLVSFFLHEEVARLYARRDGDAAAAELAHRLHSVYYAAPADRSVRNVIATIDLLVEYPEATADAQARWDHVNALLQVLKGRWETRAAAPPASARLALLDVDQSTQAVERAFALMDDLSPEVAAGHEYWPARKAYLERTLMRPLRTYRSRLLPHHLRETQRTNDAEGETAETASPDDA